MRFYFLLFICKKNSKNKFSYLYCCSTAFFTRPGLQRLVVKIVTARSDVAGPGLSGHPWPGAATLRSTPSVGAASVAGVSSRAQFRDGGQTGKLSPSS